MISGSVGGYSAEFLSPKEQERFTFVKTKICGNKAVDVQNLEKNGMSSVVEALRRMQWMDVATFTEVSYPDLVKAFFVCLKSEADGSLVSSVKGIQNKVDHELLHTLFVVKTSGHSGVHTVNDEAKGLGIIGPVQNGIWTKTSVAEGEAIIGDVPEIQEEAADPPAALEGEQTGNAERLIENAPETDAPSQENPPPASAPVKWCFSCSYSEQISSYSSATRASSSRVSASRAFSSSIRVTRAISASIRAIWAVPPIRDPIEAHQVERAERDDDEDEDPRIQDD
ncbi:hypothetical protein Taro_048338 [Colocasia esculenta]|uniref:Uncharacterized protein n=1 Tax=Colocasia esculenta TaxID=4460 RepID=A0A843WVJ2_COLES|nr:hypothetical protein [Colocasia esculenta]